MSRHRAAARGAHARPGRGRRGRGALGLLAAGAVAATVLLATREDAPDATHATPALVPRSAVPAGPTPPPTSPPARPPRPQVDLDRAVAAAEGAAAESAPGRLDRGIVVFDGVTGATAQGADGDEVFHTASLSKVIVAVDMLARARAGAARVDGDDLSTLRSALGPSSDPAMNTLWSGFDGAAGVTRVAQRLGMAETEAPENPSQWGEARTSARDMVRLMRHVRFEMAAADRDVILGALTDPPARASDGFDQGYGLLGGGGPVKQGWLCCLESSIDLHTLGVVDDRYVVAMMTNQPFGYERARAVLDSGIRALRGSLGDTPTG